MNSLVSYVDPFIGVDRGGNTLCGPYLPHSLVRLGPDTVPPHPTNGYESNKPIVYFSHTHVSGTGGGGRYGNIGVLPFVGDPVTHPGSCGKQEELAEPGYYRVTLLPSQIEAELTVTPRVGVHRYTFPAGTKANILIDVGAVIQTANLIPGDRSIDGTGASTGGFVEFVSDTEVVGRGDYRGGWGHYFPYSVFFYARFDKPCKKRIAANQMGTMGNRVADGAQCRTSAQFGECERVEIRVGISFVSIAKARASVERETGSKDFDRIRKEASSLWEQSLSRIRVEGGSENQRRLFYTQFYRLLCLPTDLGTDDEFPLWTSGVRHFTDYYTIWDSVRNANALITLLDPKLEVDMLSCLLDIAEHTGWLPDVWIAGHSGMVQGGCSPDLLFCEAALKGLEGIDYRKALRFMRKNNEVQSPDPSLYGRYLEDYRDLGYVSTNVRKNSVSRHLEYAYQDWCIGKLANQLGETRTAQKFYESSRKIWNLWREDIRFFSPRHPNGEWVTPFDPAGCYPDSWNDPYFYEGTSWQWSWNVQHDFAGLVARLGGTEGFVERLDRFFEEGHYHSKETMLHTPYLYHYAGCPAKSSSRARSCLAKYFRPTRDGLSDNEDMGCQSAFLMLVSMGIYPIMGQDLYLLSTPVFERIEIDLGATEKTLVVEAPGAEPGRPYIRTARVNSKSLDRAWVTHGEIAGGGTIHFELSAVPTGWGEDTPPPSPMENKS